MTARQLAGRFAALSLLLVSLWTFVVQPSPASAAGPATGAGYTPLTPARILDSRPDGPQVGPYNTPWGPGVTRDVTVLNVGGVPAAAQAVLLNVTVTNPTAASFLTIWPTGSPKPTASSLNFGAGQTIANAVTVKVGTGGKVSVYNPGGNVHVIFDVDGYYQPGTGSGFTPLSPARILDSRSNTQVGPYNTPWGPGFTRAVNVTNVGGVPAYATAVTLNVTVTNPTAPSFLTIWPNGSPKPTASSLNFGVGQTIPNAVTVKTGVGGAVSVFNPGGNVHVIFDVVGYYYVGTGYGYVPLTPKRVLDTRPTGPQVGPFSTPIGPNTQRLIDPSASVPAGAQALLWNVTVTNPTASSFLTIWPNGATKPVASSLNYGAGETIPNAVTVKRGTGGSVLMYNLAGSANTIIDLDGYFA